ncbi:MAG: hypothetical protein JW808_10225 [Victivallales bacterium]|nr:hypothetical protein [Victivallales bacterium]
MSLMGKDPLTGKVIGCAIKTQRLSDAIGRFKLLSLCALCGKKNELERFGAPDIRSLAGDHDDMQ